MDTGAVPPDDLTCAFAVLESNRPGVSAEFPAILPLRFRALTIYIRHSRAHVAIDRQRAFPGREHAPLNSDGYTMIGRELYSIKEARELLGGISRNSIYELLRSGDLPSVVLGCRRFIAATAIAELIEKSTTRVSPSQDCARSRTPPQKALPLSLPPAINKRRRVNHSGIAEHHHGPCRKKSSTRCV